MIHAEIPTEASLRALEGAAVDHDPATGEPRVSEERERILAEAARLVVGDRQRDYGPPSESFCRIADLWSTYLRGSGAASDVEIEAHHVAMMMVLLKISRSCESPQKRDSYVDAAGYVALAGELTAVEG